MALADAMRGVRRCPAVLAGLAVAFALSLAATPATAATTTEITPPLGILIVPEGQVPSEPTTMRESPVPEARPLGVLIGPNSAAPAIAPSAVPAPVQVPASAPITPAIEPAVHVPAPGNTKQRPLGVLIEEPPAYTPPAQPAVTARPATTPTPTAPAIVRPAVPGATTERPLGTLIAPAPAPLVGTAPAAAAQPTPMASSPSSTSYSSPAPATTIPVAAPDAAPTADAAGVNNGQPVRLVADEMSFDRDNNIVTASGNVQVTHGARSLVADQVIYKQNEDVATAIGHVVLYEATGERLFGERMEISGDLKDAVIHNIGLILKDHSRVAGVGARHSGGRVTELRKGVYSPCEPCAKDPSRPPLWQQQKNHRPQK